MAPIIRMPPVEALPDGPRREFVKELHEHYRDAKWPPLRKVDKLLSEMDDLAGMASKETVRRMLRGQTVPRNWETVEATLVAFCKLAGKSPENRTVGDLTPYGDPLPGPTLREVLLFRWQDAIEGRSDEALSNDRPRSTPPPQGNGLSDEPPF